MVDLGSLVQRALAKTPNPSHTAQENESLIDGATSILGAFSVVGAFLDALKVLFFLGIFLFLFELQMTLLAPIAACIALHLLVSCIVRYRAAKLLPGLMKRDSRSVKAFLIRSSRYSVIEDISRLFSIVLVAYALFVIAPELFSAPIHMRGSTVALSVVLILSVVGVYALWTLLTRLLFFYGYSRIDDSQSYVRVRVLADVFAKNRKDMEKVPLFIVAFAAIGGYCWTQGIWQGVILAVVILAVIFAMIVLRVFTTRRQLAADYSSDAVVAEAHERTVSVEYLSGEQLLTTIYGIIFTSAGKLSLAIEFRPFAPKQKLVHPENTLVVTNRRLLFVLVPLEVASMHPVGVGLYETQMWNRDAIRDEGKRLFGSDVLAGATKNCVREIRYDVIDRVVLHRLQLDISFGGDTVRYIFFDKEYLSSLTSALRDALGDKFVVQE